MKIYSFDKRLGSKITDFNSNFILSKVIRTDQTTQIGCFHLETNGIVGAHEAAVPQLMLVVSGEGYVQSDESAKVFVEMGNAVFWNKGEEHETTTETALTAIVIESKELHPENYMPLKAT